MNTYGVTFLEDVKGPSPFVLLGLAKGSQCSSLGLWHYQYPMRVLS